MQENKTRLRQIRWQSDLPKLIVIERAGFAKPWDAKKFFDFSFRPDAGGVVAEDVESGEIIAFMLYLKTGDKITGRENAFHVSHIAVHPRHQSKGIGRSMLMSLCREETVLTLNVRRTNVRAQELYLHLGFGVVDELTGHYPDGEDALVMRYLEGAYHVECVS